MLPIDIPTHSPTLAQRCTWRSDREELRAEEEAEDAAGLDDCPWVGMSEEGERALAERGVRISRKDGVQRVYLAGGTVDQLGTTLGY